MKKKAFKVATASAIAASAFVAAAPAQTDAASNVAVEVSKAVTQMKKAYHTYSDITASGEFQDLTVVYKEYNAAKVAYNNAKALVKQAGGSMQAAYEAQLDVTYNDYIAKRVITYIDAYNYAVTLDAKRESLEAALTAKNWDAAEKLYHEISYELKTRTVILDRVYGKTTRELLRGEFKADAQDARDSIAVEVTVKMALDVAAKELAEKDLSAAKAALDKAAEWVGKLDKDTDFGKDLLTKNAEASAQYEALLTPAVESVSAINAKTIEIKFNKPMKESTLVNSGATDTLNSTNVVIDEVGTASVVTDASVLASLSADGKTLTLTAAGAEYFKGQYTILVKKEVESAKDEALTAYSSVLTVNDTVRPSVVGVSYTDSTTAVIKFSEQLQGPGSVTFARADGVAFTGAAPSASLDADGNIEVNLSGINAADVDKDITVTIVGAVDYVGNLVSPNPVTATVKLSTADQVAPTVSTVTALANNKLEVKFSEQLNGNPTVVVPGATVTGYIKDSTDPTKYIVSLDTRLTGLQNVTVSGFSDKSLNAGSSTVKIVNFSVDTVDPTVAATRVEKINGVEHLIVTFNESVSPVNAKAIAGTVVKDFVTSSASITTSSLNFSLYNPVNGMSNSVKLDITALTAGAYTVTLPTGVVQDLNGRDSVSKQVSFTRDSNTDATKPEIDTTVDASELAPLVASNGITVTGSNKLTVSFDKKLDGASATNAANYRIEGAVVTSAVLTSNTTSAATVELTLDNNVSVTGLRNVTISGVKADNGVVMNDYHTTEYLTENVKPTFTAKLTAANAITLTFSENVINVIGTTGEAADDFVVKVDGVDVTTFAASPMVVSENGTDGGKTYTITFDRNLTSDEYAKAITVTAANGLDVEDQNRNALTFTSVNVSK